MTTANPNAPRVPAAGAGNGAANAPPVLDATTQKMIDGLTAAGGPPLYTMTPQAARDLLTKIQSTPVTKQPASITDTTFPVGPTGQTRVRIVRPDGAKGDLPVVIWCHGGGWILGDKDTHDRLIREMANGTGAAIVFVDYDRSPEARYPVAIEQAYEATKYVAEHGAELGVDASRLALAGESVGGNMAAVVVLLAKQRKGPKIAFQLLYYPVTDSSMSTASYARYKDGPWLTAGAMAWFWDAYLPDKEARKAITASPLQASIEQLRGLPETMIIVDENDVLRDEGEAYAQKLTEAGNRVSSLRINGTVHDFIMLNPIAESPPTRTAIRQGIDALKRALAR